MRETVAIIVLAYGITEDNYFYFISRILEANVYDYIIFDVSSELTLFKTKLMAKCYRGECSAARRIISV